MNEDNTQISNFDDLYGASDSGFINEEEPANETKTLASLSSVTQHQLQPAVIDNVTASSPKVSANNTVTHTSGISTEQ